MSLPYNVVSKCFFILNTLDGHDDHTQSYHVPRLINRVQRFSCLGTNGWHRTLEDDTKHMYDLLVNCLCFGFKACINKFDFPLMSIVD